MIVRERRDQLPRMWCARCREETVLIDKRKCLWCDGKLTGPHQSVVCARTQDKGVVR